MSVTFISTQRQTHQRITQQLQRNSRTLYTVASGPEQSPELPQCQVYLRVDLSNIVGSVTIDRRPQTMAPVDVA